MNYCKKGNQWIVILEKGEKITKSIKKMCKETGLKAGIVSAIGAGTDIKIGYFDLNTKVYNEKVFKEYYEITSLIGNISTKNGEPYTHLHINFSGEDCIGYGGHFVEGCISVTCEMFITEIEGELNRVPDDDTGINIINF